MRSIGQADLAEVELRVRGLCIMMSSHVLDTSRAGWQLDTRCELQPCTGAASSHLAQPEQHD